MLLKINSHTPPVASLLVLEHLKDAVNVQVESAKGNLLQPAKVRYGLNDSFSSDALTPLLLTMIVFHCNHSGSILHFRCFHLALPRAPSAVLPSVWKGFVREDRSRSLD